MRVPDHYIHIYDRPAQGTGFQSRYRVYRYKHKVEAFGNCITASCDIAVNPSQAEYFYNNFLGCFVAFYVDNPGEAIWEGLISRITLSNGGVKRSTSIDDMANRLRVASHNSATTTATRALTADADNTDSQAIYGIKSDTLDGPLQAASTLANGLRDMNLADRSWPSNSAVPDSGSGFSLSIECIGISQTLEWELAYVTGAVADSVAINLNVDMTNQITNLDNGTTFFDNTDTTLIDTNASFNIRKYVAAGQTKYEWISTVTEAGDGVNRWVFGITKTLNGTRRFYYRAGNANTLYTVYIRDGMRIRNEFGRIVPPWSVKPDGFLVIRDLEIAFNGIGDDPRETYLSGIEYDQASQKVTWISDDNITIDGALRFTRPVLRYGLNANARAHRLAI